MHSNVVCPSIEPSRMHLFFYYDKSTVSCTSPIPPSISISRYGMNLKFVPGTPCEMMTIEDVIDRVT